MCLCARGGGSAWRLLPFLFVLYIIAFLDRVNVGYAGLEMARDLAFSDRVFGLGAGIFSIGYFIFEIPGALIVERWSARRWIARILITWGAVTILVAAVHTPRQFYAARFLLGVAEAGFFPGLLVYLTHWFRHEDSRQSRGDVHGGDSHVEHSGRAVRGVDSERALAGMAGMEMAVRGGGHSRGFIWRGDSVVSDGLAGGGEVAAAGREGMAERRVAAGKRSEGAGAAMHGVAGAAAAGGGAADAGLFSGDHRDIWIHHLVSDDCEACDRSAELEAMLLSALPYVAGVGAMLLNGWHSDRTGERRWHTAFPLFLGGAALGLTLLVRGNLPLGFAAMIVAGACTTAFMPSFWALPTESLTASAAAASIGFINSVGNLGGFAGPYFIGYLRTATGSFAPGLGFLLACTVLAGGAILLLRKPAKRAG